MNSPLSSQKITALRSTAAQHVAIDLVAETGSTNADLLAQLDRLSAPLLLLAEHQTAGRGRAGRTWHSAPGASLTLSLAWQFKRPLQDLVGLPLAVGVVIADTLALFNVEARLKWPNDVLKDGKKLAGILIETVSTKNTAEPATWAVIGIGINTALPDSLTAAIGHAAAADVTFQELDRNALAAALLNGLCEALPDFEERGFDAFTARWNLLHAYAGQPVAIIDDGQLKHEGTAAGVDSIGRLLLDTANGRVAVMAGDVSLRIAQGESHVTAG